MLFSHIEKCYNWLYYHYSYISNLWNKYQPPLKLTKKISLLMQGFFPQSYYLYGDVVDKSYLINNYQEHVKLRVMNRDIYELTENKILFQSLVGTLVKMPEILAIVRNGKLIPTSPRFRIESIEDIVIFLQFNDGLVIKPVWGYGGTGIFLLKGGETLILNGKETSKVELKKLILDLPYHMVTLMVKQADYSSTIYPHTTNTIRFLTITDPEDGQAFIAACAHRLGTDESFPVDNCGKGGLTAKIDLISGQLSKATKTKTQSSQPLWYAFHPNTGSPIEGVMIPNWDFIRESMINLAQKLSFLRYVGWDVVITEEGLYVLEANRAPDLKLHQVHEPLLKNERVAKCFRLWGIIK